MCSFTLLVPRPYWDPDTDEAGATLELAIPLLEEAAGGHVDGIIGDTDPFVAVRDDRHQARHRRDNCLDTASAGVTLAAPGPAPPRGAIRAAGDSRDGPAVRARGIRARRIDLAELGGGGTTTRCNASSSQTSWPNQRRARDCADPTEGKQAREPGAGLSRSCAVRRSAPTGAAVAPPAGAQAGPAEIALIPQGPSLSRVRSGRRRSRSARGIVANRACDSPRRAGENERPPRSAPALLSVQTERRARWARRPGVKSSAGAGRLVLRSQVPGARYSTEHLTARSTSSGVRSTTVLVATAPDEFTAIAIAAAALSLSGKSAIT